LIDCLAGSSIVQVAEEPMADQILNVVCICGSLRKGSYNRMVMNALPKLAPPNLKLAEAPPFAEFPLYNADMQEASGSAQARRRDPRRRRRHFQRAGI
jgi:hypothetical protein